MSSGEETSRLEGARTTPAEGARWEPDPTGRHEYRYWDGERWTEHIANSGVQSVDDASLAAQIDAAPPPHAATTRHTNGLAVASLILSIVQPGIGSVLAIIFGHIARRQIRQSNGTQKGNGLALAGLIIGYGLGIAILVALVLLSAAASQDS
jgi:hypothetical protein